MDSPWTAKNWECCLGITDFCTVYPGSCLCRNRRMLALNQTSPSLYSGQSNRPPRGRLGTIQQCGRLLLQTLVAALKATNIDICWTHFLCYNCVLKSRAHYQISIIQVFFSALRLRLKGIRLVESAPAGLKGAESCFWLEAFSIQDKTEYAQRQTT